MALYSPCVSPHLRSVSDRVPHKSGQLARGCSAQADHLERRSLRGFRICIRASAPQESRSASAGGPSTTKTSATELMQPHPRGTPGCTGTRAAWQRRWTAYGQWIKKGLRTKRVVTPEGVKGSATDPTYLLTSKRFITQLDTITNIETIGQILYSYYTFFFFSFGYYFINFFNWFSNSN